MSRGLSQPVGQKRLTNIAVVRMKKGGDRFEIACYRNKVGDWRDGIEKDLDEVLQTTTIFANVSKGVVAKKDDLNRAFGTTDETAVCLEILNKGELQVSDRERKVDFDNLFRDVASLLSDKCVNPDTNRPYTITMLERALRDIHFNVDPKKSAKQLMLEAVPLLQQRFPIARAKMGLRMKGPIDKLRELLDYLAEKGVTVREEEAQDMNSFSVTAQVEPGLFRDIHAVVQTSMGGRGHVEVVTLAAKEGAALDELSMPSTTRQAAAPAQPTAAESRRQDEPSCTTTAPAANGSSGTRRQEESGQLIYRGPISTIPEDHASRRERFAELDSLQEGWEVELRSRGETVDAVFFSPGGEKVGAFANARRAALLMHKKAQQ